MQIRSLYILLIFLAAQLSAVAQDSYDIFGFGAASQNNRFRLSTLEANPANYSPARDWELSLSYGSFLGPNVSSNLLMISISKQIAEHYLYARYTPAFKKSFIFSTGTQLAFNDETEVESVLKAELDFEEKYGFGYSYKFTDNFSAGFSLRYFEQKFSKEEPVTILTDTLNYFSVETTEEEYNFWRGDIGIHYRLNELFSASLSSVNLLIMNEKFEDETGEQYTLRKTRGAVISLRYSPVSLFSLHTNIETTLSYAAGVSINTNLFGGSLSLGASLMHDKYQTPHTAGIVPVINYSAELFSINLSGVKYFSDRNNSGSFTEFKSDGIHNIMNNRYSYDKVVLSVNAALSFTPEQQLQFLDVEIKGEIFPTIYDEYTDKPFAVARVINLTDDPVTVQPASYIENVNEDWIYSPTTDISPRDTAEVEFFTIIEKGSLLIDKREIVQAGFYLTSEGGGTEDEMKKPVLLNDKNSWDGKVSNLKYFVKADINSSKIAAREILSSNKDKLSGSADALTAFTKIKLLFDRFASDMMYVSDPRSSNEHVQFPQETLELRGGDCDDLSVCFAALCESTGIQTAFVDYRKTSNNGLRHVNLLINTGLRPEEAGLITQNDKKYFLRKNHDGYDEVWIPVETTSLTDFKTAWEKGADKFYKEAVFNFGLAKNDVFIVDIY